ncbi:MAG: IS4 family transposase, partial [Desulfobacteraceae bacterium]|nr:IS4 family transposase [Desulfobacteraceae bacterium]
MPELIEELKNLVVSEAFCEQHKENPKDFTRTRILPFHELIFFLLNMNNSSYQTELNRYFKVIQHLEIAERTIHKGNLSKARAKLKHEAFIELNDHMLRHFYSNFPFETWFGFNLLAIDGTTLRVPDEKKILEHFGAWHSTKGKKPCPKARGSQMFDVLNKVTIDAIISPKSEGERELAAFHFLKLQPEDLILLDRGYPAHWLFKLILSMGSQFCARISYKKWKVVKKFYRSGKKEQIVKIDTTPTSKRKCFEMGLDIKPMTVRLVRIELDSGESEILTTSLTDMDQYPHRVFAELYHLRWPVEEDYKTLKYRLKVENFSGKTVHSVYQDFHAKLFSKNFTAIIATTTKDEIIIKSEPLK